MTIVNKFLSEFEEYQSFKNQVFMVLDPGELQGESFDKNTQEGMSEKL